MTPTGVAEAANCTSHHPLTPHTTAHIAHHTPTMAARKPTDRKRDTPSQIKALQAENIRLQERLEAYQNMKVLVYQSEVGLQVLCVATSDADGDHALETTVGWLNTQDFFPSPAQWTLARNLIPNIPRVPSEQDSLKTFDALQDELGHSSADTSPTTSPTQPPRAAHGRHTAAPSHLKPP